MMANTTRSNARYATWLVPSGVFHWINAIGVLLLIFLSFIMMFRTELGFSGLEAKNALKFIHSLVGFLVLANLLVRGYRRLRYGKQNAVVVTRSEIMSYTSEKLRRPMQPANGARSSSRLVVLLMFALLTVSTSSGIIRAGTDLYLPPVGYIVKFWIADDSSAPVSPASMDNIDKRNHHLLNQIKIPFGLIHRWSAYFLMALIVLHVIISSDLGIRRNKN